MSKNKESRLMWKSSRGLDGLRGWAALMVCIFHIVPTDKPYWISIWTSSLGSLGVYSFFIISGFAMCGYISKNSKMSAGEFLSRRWLRLYPPFIVIIFVNVLICLFLNHFVRGAEYPVSAKQIFLNLFLLASFFNEKWINEIFWTLAVEWQFYILMGGMMLLRKPLQTLFIIFASISPFLPIVFGSGQNQASSYAPFFAIGGLFYFINIQEDHIIKWILIISNVLVLIVVFGWVSALALLLFVICLFYHNVLSSVERWLGHISYSLYLVHSAVLFFFPLVLHYFFSHLNAWLVTLACLLASMLVATIFSILLEKPFHQLSRSRNWGILRESTS